MSWRAFFPNMLWLNRRFGHRKVDYAAPIIPGDDALAAYCEQYIVCDNDVETFCDHERDDSGSSSQDSAFRQSGLS